MNTQQWLDKVTSSKEELHHWLERQYIGEMTAALRIRALADSDKVDADIREVFRKILPDEEFHEKAFGAMSDDESIEFMREKHEAGLDLLGLEI